MVMSDGDVKECQPRLTAQRIVVIITHLCNTIRYKSIPGYTGVQAGADWGWG